ncbi:hypothetical protein ACHAXT_003072 [Thalassiosira profunda]
MRALTDSVASQPSDIATTDESGFRTLIQKAVRALVKGDTDGEELSHSYGSASQGLWLHAPSAREMQDVLDRVGLKVRMPTSLSAKEGADAWEHSGGNALVPRHNNARQSRRHDDEDAFDTLIRTALQTLIDSDVQKPDGSSTQGRWVYDPTAQELQNVLDRLAMPQDTSIDSALSLEDEQCSQWLQWMKAAPSPLFLDLTTHVRDIITETHRRYDDNAWISEEHLKFVDMSLDEYISRLACHVILLPSGSETAPLSLVESTGSHVYGKLLYGGVTRFRLLKSGKTVRRAGESREVLARNNRQQPQQQSHPSWVQLGGLERRYEAIDMGPAAVLELTLLPRGFQDLPTIFDKGILKGDASGDMTILDAALGWDPSSMLQLLPKEEKGAINGNVGTGESSEDGVFGSLEGHQRNDALTSHFKSRVGGLQPQIDAIVRRVLDGRSIYATHSEGGEDGSARSQSRLEAEELSLLGLHPVRGLLLYGRPGVGKTLIVRETARLLTARPPKIVSAPELLDRWVGGSERLVRELFGDAEEELKACRAVASPGEEATAHLNSALHVIVIDEIDAVFRKRSSAEDGGEATRSSVVNQLLAKLDGVQALPNVLMIGMTNRRELLDPALLRPGRLEVQLEIPMPERLQRREILQIHFNALRRRNRLSYPLRCAIDGIATSPSNGEDVYANSKRQRGRKRRALKRAATNAMNAISTGSHVYDLADETEDFSGADIEGLVRCAGSRALSRARKDGGGVNSLLITLEDVEEALTEVKA